jgi:hypothetical protein
MNEGTAIQLRLYRGGYGIIYSKSDEPILAKITDVNEDERIVSGIQYQLKSKSSEKYLNQNDMFFEIAFDDILYFKGTLFHS